MILRRKTTPRNQKVEDAINRFFKSHKTRAIGTHGTTSERLESIRQEGLNASSERFGPGVRRPFGTYFLMTKGSILRILKHHGTQGLYREFVNQIEGNLEFSESKARASRLPASGFGTATVFLSDFGLMVGKVRSGFLSGFGEIVTGSIPKQKILLTLSLSKQDIGYLNKKLPEFNEAYTLEYLDRHERERLRKLKTEIAKIFARKIITSLLSPTK